MGFYAMLPFACIGLNAVAQGFLRGSSKEDATLALNIKARVNDICLDGSDIRNESSMINLAQKSFVPSNIFFTVTSSLCTLASEVERVAPAPHLHPTFKTVSKLTSPHQKSQCHSIPVYATL